jgi:hypothetical protein
MKKFRITAATVGSAELDIIGHELHSVNAVYPILLTDIYTHTYCVFRPNRLNVLTDYALLRC